MLLYSRGDAERDGDSHLFTHIPRNPLAAWIANVDRQKTFLTLAAEFTVGKINKYTIRGIASVFLVETYN